MTAAYELKKANSGHTVIILEAQQPVGGMDKLAHGFLPHVESLIRYRREVTSVRNADDDKVQIRHRAAGEPSAAEETITADWCISTIPAWILGNDIDNNLSKPFQAALKAAKRGLTCKVGWQADRRFWELMPYQMGGGRTGRMLPPLITTPSSSQTAVSSSPAIKSRIFRDGGKERCCRAHYVLRRIMSEGRMLMKAAPTAKRRAPSTRAVTEGIGRTRKE